MADGLGDIVGQRTIVVVFARCMSVTNLRPKFLRPNRMSIEAKIETSRFAKRTCA
jgi:hypothetical protein